MSIPRSLLRIWYARLATKVAVYGAIAYDLSQVSKARGTKDSAGNMKLAVGDDARRSLRAGGKKRDERRTMEDVFIGSLVAAGSCREHAAPWQTRPRSTAYDGHRTARRTRSLQQRQFGTIAPKKQQAAAAAALPNTEITREDYVNLVNTYDSPADLWDKPEHDPLQRTPPTPKPPPLPEEKEHHPLAPRLVIPAEHEDHAPRTIFPPEDTSHRNHLRTVRRLLTQPPGRLDLPAFWHAYEALPAPRLRYLADSDIRRAFRHLAWVEHRHVDGHMQRYFALLDECVAAGIELRTAEWNTAIAYAGRWVRYTTTSEVRGAVEMWMRMESTPFRRNDGGGAGAKDKQANAVTFNILFDVAVKAGRFALADTIFAELQARQLPLTRFFRTSAIYYAGMRGHGAGVRRFFRELVEAGELVDTIVMNCVLVSLIRAGEPSAAETVFARMKSLVARELGGAEAPRSWQERREMGRVLHQTATKLRRERQAHEQSFFGAAAPPAEVDQRREEVQRLVPIAPDARTYGILIQHHAYTSGDLARIHELLAEMKAQGWQVHGSVYTNLLRGFGVHGGFAYTAWNRDALEEVWEAYLATAFDTLASETETGTGSGATDAPTPNASGEESEKRARVQSEEARAPYFTRALAHAALRAWYKCAGRARMLEVWDDIKCRWETMGRQDREVLQRLVERLGRE